MTKDTVTNFKRGGAGPVTREDFDRLTGETMTRATIMPLKASEAMRDQGPQYSTHEVPDMNKNLIEGFVPHLKSQLSQPEFMDAIVEKLWEKLQPAFEFAHARQERGLLLGMPEIGKYLATMSSKRKMRPVTDQTLRRWWMNLGLPLAKTPQGFWCATKAGLDKWIYDRGVLMHKLKELGYSIVSGRGKKGGLLYDAPPEWYKPEEVAHARREMVNDKIKATSIMED